MSTANSRYIIHIYVLYVITGMSEMYIHVLYLLYLNTCIY